MFIAQCFLFFTIAIQGKNHLFTAVAISIKAGFRYPHANITILKILL